MCVVKVSQTNFTPTDDVIMISFGAVLSVPANFTQERPTKFFLVEEMIMIFQVFSVLIHLRLNIKYFTFRVSAG